MARRYRYEYLMKKRAKERARMEREERLQNLSSSGEKMRELFGWVAYIVVLVCVVHLTVTYVGQGISRSRQADGTYYEYRKRYGWSAPKSHGL